MNRDEIKGQWKQVRGRAKEEWGKLTDDDLDRANGEFDQLVGVIQERYGKERADAHKEVERFFDRMKDSASR